MPRPRFHPTDEQRKLVKSLAALGLTQDQIAHMVGIRSTKTLRKYFRPELDRGDLEGYAKVQQTHFQMATDGKHWLATRDWLDAYHRRHGHGPDQGGSVSPPEKREVSRIVGSPRSARKICLGKGIIIPRQQRPPPILPPRMRGKNKKLGPKRRWQLRT